ncbi:MAG TPA: hypothetical protein H9804_10440 [Candidatus Mucispirillum faecigallinarum]|uniref:Uncharacterized protein n=1 Tax=Candidatus Mucispirillum faecigallinarum TaxID=2838699 RepID=A0A9D2KDS9_9BACT|nr:hypothetical protein [Candidatus Mucispirillum faecigallinarum]
MGELIKRLEQAQPINDEKANKLAEWIREHQEDLLYLIKQGYQIRKIQTEAMLDLGDKYPHDINFETALCFSLLQLEAVKKEMPKDYIVNIPVVDTVEDLERVEKQKIQAEIEPFKVGSKKYYYAKYVLDNKENEVIKLSASKKGVQEYLYKKRDKTFDAYGNPVGLDIIEIRYATQDELKKMGIIDAGENK